MALRFAQKFDDDRVIVLAAVTQNGMASFKELFSVSK